MQQHSNAYVMDGLCHNAEPGTYGHECGKPAVWVGVNSNGFASGYCDDCKRRGHEAKQCTGWARREDVVRA
jgi:hypothetical protein